jgi:hypothetical protein
MVGPWVMWAATRVVWSVGETAAWWVERLVVSMEHLRVGLWAA